MNDNDTIKNEGGVEREVRVKPRKIAEALDKYLNDQDPNSGFDYVDEHTVPRTRGGYNHYAVDIRELHEKLDAPSLVSVEDPDDYELRGEMINMVSDELEGQSVVVVGTKGDISGSSSETVRIHIKERSLKSLAKKQAERASVGLSERKKMSRDEHNSYVDPR